MWMLELFDYMYSCFTVYFKQWDLITEQNIPYLITFPSISKIRKVELSEQLIDMDFTGVITYILFLWLK